MSQSSWKAFQAVSTAKTIQLVRLMVEEESRGYGDTDNALRRLETKLGVGFWTLWHLYQRRAKAPSGDLCERIRCGYLNYIESKAGALLAGISNEKATHLDDPDLEALEASARDLARQIAEKKAALKAQRRGRS